MKYYYVKTKGTNDHTVIRFGNDETVSILPILPEDNFDLEKFIDEDTADRMIPVTTKLIDTLDGMEILDSKWIPGLTADEEEELRSFTYDYEDQEEFLEGYLSAGYETWSDPFPELEDDIPDETSEPAQDVYAYLKKIWDDTQR